MGFKFIKELADVAIASLSSYFATSAVGSFVVEAGLGLCYSGSTIASYAGGALFFTGSIVSGGAVIVGVCVGGKIIYEKVQNPKEEIGILENQQNDEENPQSISRMETNASLAASPQTNIPINSPNDVSSSRALPAPPNTSVPQEIETSAELDSAIENLGRLVTEKSSREALEAQQRKVVRKMKNLLQNNNKFADGALGSHPPNAIMPGNSESSQYRQISQLPKCSYVSEVSKQEEEEKNFKFPSIEEIENMDPETVEKYRELFNKCANPKRKKGKKNSNLHDYKYSESQVPLNSMDLPPSGLAAYQNFVDLPSVEESKYPGEDSSIYTGEEKYGFEGVEVSESNSSPGDDDALSNSSGKTIGSQGEPLLQNYSQGSENAKIRKKEKRCKCQLTRKRMVDPVKTKYGSHYSRKAILEYIQKEGKDPITGKPLTKEDLKKDYKAVEFLRHLEPEV